MPKVSVIVPVYKVEQYLEKCVDSILSQTFSDYELILVDDGSPDNCPLICDEYAAQDSRVHVIHQKNGGVSAARNAGIKWVSENSGSEWITFIDSDDLVHPQMLELLVHAAEDCGVDMSVCGRLEAEIVPDSFWKNYSLEYMCMDLDEESLVDLCKSNEQWKSDIYWTVIPKLIRKEIICTHLFVKDRLFEDNEASCRWLTMTQRTAIIDAKMYFYRTNPNGIMQSKFSKKKLDYLWALESQVEFYDGIDYKNLRETVAHEYFNTVIWMGNCVKEQLGDRKLLQQMMLHTESVYKKWNKAWKLEVEESKIKHIKKYAHPVKYKIKRMFHI